MTKWRGLFLLSLLIGLIAILLVYHMNREVPVVARPTVTLETHLADSAKDFFARNNIDPEPRTKTDSGELYEDWGILAFTAFAGRPEDPEGYILKYKAGDCTATLPAGRYVQVDHEAGFFTTISSTLPLDPVSFEDVMVLSRQIGDGFDKAGWKRTQYKPDIKQETFGESSLGSKFEYFGKWMLCNDPNLRVSIQIKYYNTLPSGPSIPPVPGSPLPKDYPDRYVIEVMFDSPGSDIEDEATELRDARRVAVGGDKDKPSTLKSWIDDPAWRPEGWQGKIIK
ncbi:hypothetical protein [Phyllobacterium sp. YR531]|uniref:hypothetical protein n=1 Tax=Phyllobacterium sp. YR531 TaxID=1144343 RepID=UPI00026F5BDF|nr:hypothetical protein [Phyllobacterium sp. YR531]EJM98751.1 hypothetical protein PMI41_04513 [Phyllobacterium sp. YR531]